MMADWSGPADFFSQFHAKGVFQDVLNVALEA